MKTRNNPLSILEIACGLLASLMAVTVFARADETAPRTEEEQILARAKTVHEKVLTLDSHVDIPGEEYGTGELDPGIDHVDIGTDFDGGGGFNGFSDHSQTLNVTVELVRRGYSDEDIRKIWGGNLLRTWRVVDKVAQPLQQENGR